MGTTLSLVLSLQPGTYLDQKEKLIKYSDFVYKELILFSMADLQRSIPSITSVKETRFEPGSRMNVLKVCWTSQSSANERAGRAGRTEPGRVGNEEDMLQFDHYKVQFCHSNGDLLTLLYVYKGQNGDMRSPKRLCTEYRSLLVERNPFTSPVKDCFLVLNNLKSKLPPPALQCALAKEYSCKCETFILED
ncbi:hypothetical protein RHMOL_Rhmol03G0066400 [Rhododendron molle]|uniref:Uncharacterized protein n=1 Tax=Rhododendron molle TaxID=49168 RepID=A0ACC0PDS7_RHOML|nr:hypothetical protein RHMOL_Rhmol03G0066400 [Rhododendron molle]